MWPDDLRAQKLAGDVLVDRTCGDFVGSAFAFEDDGNRKNRDHEAVDVSLIHGISPSLLVLTAATNGESEEAVNAASGSLTSSQNSVRARAGAGGAAPNAATTCRLNAAASPAHRIAFPPQKRRRANEPGAPLGHAGIGPRGKDRVSVMEKVEQSTPQTFRRETGGNVRERVSRNLRDARGGNFRGVFGRNLLPYLTVEEVTKTVSATLQPFEAKDIAHATGGSIRAANNVREGVNAMSLTGFLNACRAIPELRALALSLMGCAAETDPEFVRGMDMLLNSYVRRCTSEASAGASSLSRDGALLGRFLPETGADGSEADSSAAVGDLFGSDV